MAREKYINSRDACINDVKADEVILYYQLRIRITPAGHKKSYTYKYNKVYDEEKENKPAALLPSADFARKPDQHKPSKDQERKTKERRNIRKSVNKVRSDNTLKKGLYNYLSPDPIKAESKDEDLEIEQCSKIVCLVFIPQPCR